VEFELNLNTFYSPMKFKCDDKSLLYPDKCPTEEYIHTGRFDSEPVVNSGMQSHLHVGEQKGSLSVTEVINVCGYACFISIHTPTIIIIVILYILPYNSLFFTHPKNPHLPVQHNIPLPLCGVVRIWN